MQLCHDYNQTDLNMKRSMYGMKTLNRENTPLHLSQHFHFHNKVQKKCSHNPVSPAGRVCCQYAKEMRVMKAMFLQNTMMDLAINVRKKQKLLSVTTHYKINFHAMTLETTKHEFRSHIKGINMKK